MARYSGTTRERGLGAPHVADRKRLLAVLRDGEPCWRCGQPMYKWQELDRDHVVDRALGGTMGPAVLAHASCNRSAGAKLGNQLRPYAVRTGGRDTICAACGKPYSRAPRTCEICGAHYHPNHGEQRSCSRKCGVEVIRRNRAAIGWVSAPARRAAAKAAAREAREAQRVQQPGRATAIAYYTCRYCGKVGVTRANARQQREVCPARECQLARLAANNLITRNGMTREQADATAVAYMAEGDHRQLRPAPRTAAAAAVHKCPACGQQTARFRWCDECLCINVNAKGSRCANPASTGGKCDYHADAGALAASRDW